MAEDVIINALPSEDNPDWKHILDDLQGLETLSNSLRMRAHRILKDPSPAQRQAILEQIEMIILHFQLTKDAVVDVGGELING